MNSTDVVSVPQSPQLPDNRSAANFGWLQSTLRALPLSGTCRGRYLPVCEILLWAVGLFTVLRLAMLVWFVGLGSVATLDVAQMLWVGFRFDLLAGLCFILPQTLHLTFVPESRLNGPVSRTLLELEWIIAALFLPLLLLVEFMFFDEFQSRLNYIAFEYLVYPTEVCCNIWQSYPVIPLFGTAITAGLSVWYLRRTAYLSRVQQSTSIRRRFGFLLTAIVAIAGLWLTSGMASMQVSSHRVLNEVSGNGLYSFVSYAWTCRFEYEQYYITMPEDEIPSRLREHLSGDGTDFHENSRNPVDRTVSSETPQRNWNVVLVLEESFGSDFVGVLGDERGLTPCFDRLATEGLLLDNFYATGNRTARALEAVMTSMPPLPTESILKRDHSERVYTLANVLEERGYEREFILGGRGIFDGMRSFMTSNGFDRFVEWSDFENPVFENAWGVSDEDLFARAIDELNSLHKTGRPFFATILTVSNHRPYTFPEGRINPPDKLGRRERGVMYADWALGQFFERARQCGFYDNTLFVVMGDHGARVYGSQMFPMKSYRIPVLIIRPDGVGRAERCHTLASSLDIAPTIMGLLGGSYRSVFFGRDVCSLEPDEGYAVMQHNHDLAVLDARHHMVVLGSRRSLTGFSMNPTTHELTAETPEPERVIQAVSFFQSANDLYYSERWYPDRTVRPIPATLRDGPQTATNTAVVHADL